MLTPLPKDVHQFMEWPWSKIEPYYLDLINTEISASNVQSWLADWSRLGELLYETYERVFIATTVDTTDEAAKSRLNTFLDEVYPHTQSAEQQLKEKLLESGLSPSGFEIPLQNMLAEADVFSEANLPLLTQELKLSTEYDKIFGAQSAKWEDEEVTLTQLETVLLDTNRENRERAWRLIAGRQLADRGAINKLWSEFMDVRRQIADNVNLEDFRAYRWQKLHRFDYTPEDCIKFHEAIEEVVVPAANRLYERRRKRLGVETLRPWDIKSDPLGGPPLLPFKSVDELERVVKAIFDQVDPQFGAYFATMQQEGLLDLDNRKGKAPGGYCTDLPVIRRPYIFMNAVGTHDDVQTLLHEGGHAFHVFESASMPYLQQLHVNLEFAEVASMGMELLSAPYLTADQGGFYSPEDAARARSQYLEESICFWPYMAVVDAFQHWVYENHNEASNPDNCDMKWFELWERFMPGEDWSGLEQEKMTGWHLKSHIHMDPFYYIEYGLAMLGAFQVWQNAIEDQAGAVADYRSALSLGGTASLPQLFTTAGIEFAFDAETLQQAVVLAEKTIAELDTILNDQ